MGSPRAPQAIFELGVPVLGICYGMQTMLHQLGGTMQGSNIREFGYAQVKVEGQSALLHDIRDHLNGEGNALLHRVIGYQLTCVLVDNGLLRKNEGDHVGL